MWLLLGAVETILPFFPAKWSELFYSLSYLPHLRWYVWVIGLLVIALIAVFEAAFQLEKQHGHAAVLEIRPSPGQEAYRFTETAHGETHYRMEIYNGSETALSVQIKLVKIEPLPLSEYFRARADFPYWVRPAHLAEGNVNSATAHHINPGTGMPFELLFFWESSDHRIIVNGIDTKQALRDARFPIEDHECWRMEYEISSSETSVQKPSFFVRREQKNLFMSRLA